MSLNFVLHEVICSEKFALTRKSFRTEACNAIKLTDVFRVNGYKTFGRHSPSRNVLTSKPYLRVLIKISTWHSRGRNHSVYIFLSHVCARKLPQIKFGTSFRLNAIARTCANFREICKSGESY